MPGSLAEQNLTDKNIINYSVNLMWINTHEDVASFTIVAPKNAASFNEDIIQPAVQWAKANPVEGGVRFICGTTARAQQKKQWKTLKDC